MQLLRSMLPGHVIRKLKAGQTYIAQHHEQVGAAHVATLDSRSRAKLSLVLIVLQFSRVRCWWLSA